jgi:hypothetical protein
MMNDECGMMNEKSDRELRERQRNGNEGYRPQAGGGKGETGKGRKGKSKVEK